MKQRAKSLMLAAGVALSYFAQESPRAPGTTRAQSTSSVSLSAEGDGQTLDISNVTYEVTNASPPSRPRGERLLLRKTICTKEVIGDMDLQASTRLEAWPLGTDVRQKPLYSLKVSGSGGRTVDSALFVVDRGLEEVEWWSIYQLGASQHLFDTYTPLLSFSISRDTLEPRYVGLEVPPDDARDSRLRQPNVVAVVTYASAERVKREALLTCDDPNRAALLRSYADTTRTLTVTDGRPPRALKLRFESNDASPASPLILTIPLAGDDLDLPHAQLSPRLHLAAWKR